jgi:hypothetical protein
MDDETYNGWTNWDTWNTMLILENTQESYNWLQAWKLNWQRKMKRGVFNMTMAESVVTKYLVPAARGLAISKRFGRDFVGDVRIDPKKVNKREIVEHILSE